MVNFELGGVKIAAETSPDLFSPKGLDKGTALLLGQLEGAQYTHALDWGCGWGAMALWLAARRPEADVVGIDSDWGAVKIARVNVEKNNLQNCTIELSHGYADIDTGQKFDLIVSNPPTHRGREVVEDMIRDSLERLQSGGKLIIVIEARLKPWVQRTVQVEFGDCSVLARSSKHVVLQAEKTPTL